MLGHSDRSWNSSHPSRDCSQDGLKTTDGAGLFYRFTTNWRAAENTLLRFKVGTAKVWVTRSSPNQAACSENAMMRERTLS
jgi:hypothetical protein